jgi:hypothetical protein
MSIPGVSTDIGDAESVPVVIGANETFTVRANTQVPYFDLPTVDPGGSLVIEPGAIFYPAGQQQSISVDWAEIYNRTTDPGVPNVPWNNNGFICFTGAGSPNPPPPTYTPSLNFSDLRNSQYLGTLA